MGHCNHVLVEVADSALRRLLVSLMCIPYRDGKTMFVVSPGGGAKGSELEDDRSCQLDCACDFFP